MENSNKGKTVFVPPEDIRTKLCSKDDLYRVLTIDCKFALIFNKNYSALHPSSGVLRTNVLFLRQILKGTKKVRFILITIDDISTY